MNLITDLLFGTPTRILLVWGGGALLIILFFLRQPTALTLNSGEKGRLQISRRALRRLVEACGEGVKGVAMARADISDRGDTLYTKLRLKVRPDAKLDAIQGYLTEEITEIYRENLGIKGEIGPIEIEVVGVVPVEKTF
jgi:hypothetical protein